MKKSIVIVIFACILSNICVGVFFSNRSYKSLTVHPVKVLITHQPGVDPCILEVYPNGILEVTSGVCLGNDWLNSREYFNEGTVERRWKKLSKNECKKIDDFVNRIISECDDELERAPTDCGIVYMFIDDKNYLSLFSKFYDYASMENEAVSELAHELVKMSPIKLTGWEHYINK